MVLPSRRTRFLKTFKEPLNAARDLALRRGKFNMRGWVKSEVYPAYVSRFTKGNSNPNNAESGEEELQTEIPQAELEQVYSYFRNNCKMPKSSVNLKVASPSSCSSSPRCSSTSAIDESDDDDDDFEDDPDSKEDALPPSRRIRGLREIVAEDYHETILTELHSGSEKLGRKFFFRKWNDAITKVIKDMPQKKLDEYIAKVNKFRDENKKLPSKEETLRWQKYLPITASMYLWKLLGWKRKQYGDAVVFLSTAVRRSSGKISTRRYLISNVGKHTDKEEEFYKVWDDYGRERLSVLAEEWLPSHDKQDTPLLSQSLGGKYFIRPFDPDTVTAKEMRAVLLQYMTKLWEASGRTGSIPWSAMESLESRAPYSVDHTALREYPNLNPNSMRSEKVIPLATIFATNPTISLFKGSMNPNSTNDLDRQPIPNLPSAAATMDDTKMGATQFEPVTPPLAGPRNASTKSFEPASPAHREDHITSMGDGHTAGSAGSSPYEIPRQSQDLPATPSPQRTLQANPDFSSLVMPPPDQKAPSSPSKASSPEGSRSSRAHHTPKVHSPPVILPDSPPKTPPSTNTQQLLPKTPRTPSPKQRFLVTSPRVSSPLRQVLAVGNLPPVPQNGTPKDLTRRPPTSPTLRLAPLSPPQNADPLGEESALRKDLPPSSSVGKPTISTQSTLSETVTLLSVSDTTLGVNQTTNSVPEKRKSSAAENKNKKQKITPTLAPTRRPSKRVSRPPQPISVMAHKGQETSKRKPGYFYQDITGNVVSDSSSLPTPQHSVGQSHSKTVNRPTKPVTKKPRRK